MSTLNEVLEQVLGKALPEMSKYATMYSGEWDSKKWSELEDVIGRIYHSYLRSLLFDPHLDPQDPNPLYSVKCKVAPPFGEKITLGAINQRGLFRQNGRSTILEPCGAFLPKTRNIDHHNALHHIYMHLVQKAESINQLFLGTTKLQSLAILFGEGEKSLIHVSEDGLHCTVHVSTTLADLLAKPSLRKRWKDVIITILTTLDAEDILDSLQRKGRFPDNLSFLDSSKHQPDRLYSLDIIRKWPKLFRQWLTIYPKEDVQNIEKAGLLFDSWLWSIAWLMFYCQEDIAGRFFYTVRLPHAFKTQKHVLPESSMSLLAKVRLTEAQLNLFKSIYDVLNKSKKYAEINSIIMKSIACFRKERLGQIEKPDETDKKHANIRLVLERQYKGHDLPVDFRRMCFLLNLARSLVGRRHEGEPLRFCFIYGFGYDRLNAESNGSLEEFRAPLRPRWSRFLKHTQKAFDMTKTEEAGRNLAGWIKSNDLQLQRPDVALYFEEDANATYPLPNSLVHIRRFLKKEVHPVSTELELRQALRDLTEHSHRTVAIVTGPSGLFVFFLGLCLLVRCSGREEWNEQFYLHVTGENVVLEVQIKADLERIFQRNFKDRPKIAEKAAEVVRHLCEALVSLGHGAMFVVRAKETTKESPRLRPLNPVWLLRSTVHSCDDLKHECAIYALMAALDGATELLLPLGEKEPIQFFCRRFAQTDQRDWMWMDDENEQGDVGLKSGMHMNMWRQLVGKGTRHHTALVLSRRLKGALVITVSADGPVTIFKDGAIEEPDSTIPIRFAP